MNETLLPDHFTKIFSSLRDRTALTMNECELTYRELDEGVRKTVGWLQHRGIRPGDRIAVHMTCLPETVFLYLANLFLGTVLVPLNPRYTDREIRYFLEDSGSILFFRRVEKNEPGAEGEWHILQISETHSPPNGEYRLLEKVKSFLTLLEGVPHGPYTSDPEPDQAALLCYTSGTTGKPKAAVITQENLAALCSSLYEAWGWNERDVLLHALPLFHVHGLLVALQGALYAGARTVLLPRFDPSAVLQRLAQDEGTLFMGVPTMYNRLLSSCPAQGVQLPCMRLFVSGSAPLSVETFKTFEQRFGHTILERYGMTEAGMVLSNPLHGVRKPGSVGFPLPGVSIRIVDPDTNRDVEPGSTGELLIRSPSVCKGYWRRSDKDPETFLPGGWLRSGDLARQDEEGFIHLAGRKKELVITGGFNVYPREVEEALEQHPAVREAAVFGLPDEDLGERVWAAVVPEKKGAVNEAELIRFCKSLLTSYKCPRGIRFMERLPRNTMGKIVKADLN